MPLRTGIISNDNPGEKRGSRLPHPDAICMKVMRSEKIDCKLSRRKSPITERLYFSMCLMTNQGVTQPSVFTFQPSLKNRK